MTSLAHAVHAEQASAVERHPRQVDRVRVRLHEHGQVDRQAVGMMVLDRARPVEDEATALLKAKDAS